LHLKRRFFALLLPVVSLGLTGCNELGLRRGPSPVLDVASIQTASSNQTMIIDALAKDASDNGVFVDGADRYYLIAEAGFNYVDDQCQSYFDQLFFIDRGRGQIKSGLAAAGATTAAILGVTSASTLSMAVVASAFGFASTVTDIVAGTYLYALPPATTQDLVRRLKDTYRDEAWKMRAQINTPTAAYHHIQSYLALCLPPRIESEVVNAIGAASVNVVKGGSGSTFSVQSGTPAASNVRPIVVLNSVKTPLPPPLPSPPTNPNAVNSFEARLGQIPALIKEIQSTVCIANPDGSLGPVGSTTRANIVEFFEGFGTPRKDINSNTGGLNVKDQGILEQAFVETTGEKGCFGSGFSDPRKVGAFTKPH
jgi:hypothetical protein